MASWLALFRVKVTVRVSLPGYPVQLQLGSNAEPSSPSGLTSVIATPTACGTLTMCADQMWLPNPTKPPWQLLPDVVGAWAIASEPVTPTTSTAAVATPATECVRRRPAACTAVLAVPLVSVNNHGRRMGAPFQVVDVCPPCSIHRGPEFSH